MSGVLRKMNLEVDLGGDGLQELSDWIKKLHDARVGGHAMEDTMKDMQRALKGYGININESIAQANNFSAALKGIAGGMAASKIIGFAQDLLQQSSAYETMAVSLEVMLKDADKAKQVMKDLNEFSIKTPYKPDEVMMAGKLMLNAKVPVKELTNELTMMGDIASGAGVKIGDMAEIYAKNKFSGLVQTEDIMQLANKGIPIFDELGKVFGTTSEQIRNLASSGAIRFEHLQKAFKNMSAEGGIYFGMMDKQSRTWAGLMSTLEGNINEVKRAGGDLWAAALKPMVDTLGQFFGWITQNEAAMQVLKKVFIIMIPVIGVLLVAALWAAAAAAWAFVSPFIPFILLGVGIVAIIMAIILVIQDIYTWFKGGKSVFGKWLDPLAENVNKAKLFLINAWTTIKDFFSRNGKYIVMALFPLSALYYYWDEITAFFKSIPERITSLLASLPDKAIAALSGMGDRLKDKLKDVLPDWAIKLISKTSAEGIQARAGGGPVSAGKDYLVGELEPEIFSPASSGFITPVSAIGGSGKSGAVITIAPVINFYGSAARNDADTIVNKVVQVIEEKLYQAMAMAGLEVS